MNTRAELVVRFDDKGLSSLNFNGTELLHNGAFQPGQVLLTDAKGKEVSLAGKTEQSFDPKTGTCSLQAPWGTMQCVYQPQGDTLEIRITVSNTSPDTISIFEAAPLEVTFPKQPLGLAWDRKFEVVGDNFDDITALPADYGRDVLVACNDNVGEPLRFGFTSPIGTNTYRIRMTTCVWNSTDDPKIAPGTTKEFHFSLRFAKSGVSLNTIAGDLVKKLAAQYPFQLNWPDRRPIGMISLATQVHQSAKNPRGWFNESDLDVVSEKGRKNFAKRLMSEAKYHLSILKSMNAQGMIVWNVEGEEFPNINYVGDPRILPKLAPEMDAAADAYFAFFRKAGVRTGICIRPSRIVPGWDGKTKWTHDQMGFDFIAEMSQKIDYAQKRWGCTLFYVDSSVHYFFKRDGQVSDRLISAGEWKRLAKMHPDVLIIPEFPTTATWSVCAPYRELREHTFGGFAATPDYTLAIYPKAFSIIVPMEGPIKERHDALVAGVKRGDILLFRAFFRDEDWNRPIRQIYDEATKR